MNQDDEVVPLTPDLLAQMSDDMSKRGLLSPSMKWEVTEISVAGDFALTVRFHDGLVGGVKFSPSFFRGVFSHLASLPEFQKVQVVDGVVTWPGELDLAPDAMYAEIKRSGEWMLN